ncbi:MAG: Cof-type HAD-IIB family hydrolase [Butyrivibrio sp.]|nr:Cof-type HAD-IIB family hydrolase [Butyrivibrio sp.]
MSKNKVLFFDIDGTLWDSKSVIPESTVEAIKKLKENGHKTFINSGRSRGFIRDKKLLSLGFDGIVSACGTMIEMNNKVLFCREIDIDVVEKTLGVLKKYHFKPILEGKEYLYMDYDDFSDDVYGQKVMSDMGEFLRPISDSWNNWEICKFSCATDGTCLEDCFKELSDYYYFIVHNPKIVEFVPLGYSKGTGIEKTCECIGADIKDTFAFGDSVNDLEMLKVSGTSIVMGNGSDDVKSIADYVTTDLYDDGIWNACKYFGLI